MLEAQAEMLERPRAECEAHMRSVITAIDRAAERVARVLESACVRHRLLA